MLRPKIWILGLVAATSLIAYADVHQFSAGPRELGQGFNPFYPTRGYPFCFDSKKLEKSKPEGAGKFTLTSRLVESREDLYSYLHVDISLSAHSAAASGNINTAFDRQASFGSHDATWVVVAEQNFGAESLINDTPKALDTPASDLLGMPLRLKQMCGPEYIKSVDKSAMIAAVFTLHSDKEITSQDVRAHVDGGVSWAGNSVSMTANFRRFVSESRQHGNIEIKIYGYGGGGVSALGPVISAADLDAFQAILTKYVTTEMVASKAVGISFTTARFDSLAATSSEVPVVNESQVDQAYLSYLDVVSKQARVQDILMHRSDSYGYLSDAEIAQFAKTYAALQKFSNSNFKSLQDCTKRPSCQFEVWQNYILWPSSPEPNCTRWEHNESGPSECRVCEYPVSFASRNVGSSWTYTCTHLPARATVKESFDGYVVSSSSYPTPIWNAQVAMTVSGPTQPCQNCSDSKVTLGLGAPNSDQALIAYQRQWIRLNPYGFVTLEGTVATAQLILSHCQVGAPQATCDTAPPSKGTAEQPNDGFPPDVQGGVPLPAIFKIEVSNIEAKK